MSRLSRIVSRNNARAMKGRTLRERKIVENAFRKGVNWGSDMMRLRILSATAGMQYEEEVTYVTPAEQAIAVLPGDPMSESSLGGQANEDSIQPSDPSAIS